MDTRTHAARSAINLRAALSVLVAVMTFASLAGCSGVPDPDVPAQANESTAPSIHGDILFDMAHEEVFGADDTSALGQSRAVELIEAAGLNVVINESRFTTESVAGAAGIILPGPMRMPTFEEQDVLENYVRDGGVLVVTTHVSYPLMVFPERYGMGLTKLVVTSDNPIPGNDAGCFLATTIVPDRVTHEVDSVMVLSSWVVTADGDDARVIVSSDEDTWADDGDHARTDQDPVGPLGLVAVGHLGKGTVVLIGDDAVFANAAIGEAGNRQMFDNILGLMGARSLGA